MNNVKLIILGMLIILMPGCKKDDSDPLKELSDDLTTGSWKVSQLIIDDRDLTAQFENLRLSFSTEKAPESPSELFNRLHLLDGVNSIVGTWIFMAAGPGENFDNYLSVAFIQNSELQPISARWGINSHKKGILRLVKSVQEHSLDERFMLLERSN